jgi:hypothetical protein
MQNLLYMNKLNENRKALWRRACLLRKPFGHKIAFCGLEILGTEIGMQDP